MKAPMSMAHAHVRTYVTCQEMKTETLGGVFREVGEELGYRPHASGLNSMRRNSMVGVQKGAERAGHDPSMHAKRVSQHRGTGHHCREVVYEDTTATSDIGAFLMSRSPQRIESLKSLAMTRVPELAKYRTPADVDNKVSALEMIRVVVAEGLHRRAGRVC
jgi:hypothetical protein